MNENWITKKLDAFKEKKLVRHMNSFDATGGIIFQKNEPLEGGHPIVKLVNSRRCIFTKKK